MADIKFTFEDCTTPLDIEIAGGDIVQANDLITAVMISLFSDARAPDDEEKPPLERRGWWGDSVHPVEGHSTGSLLWLLAREKQTQATLNKATDWSQEALAWLIRDGVAASIAVESEWIRQGVMGLTIDIVKPTGEVENIRFEYAWAQIGAA